MFEVLSLLNKTTRVSRKVDATTFIAKQGIWAVLQADGSVANVVTGVPARLNKLIIGIKSDSVILYESNDVKVNRITTLETPGIKCECDSEVCVLTGLTSGARLVVSTETGAEGKLAAISQVADGDYEVVGRVLTVVSGVVTFITVSPYMITVTTSTTTTSAPSTTTTAAPTTTTAAPTTTTAAPTTTTAAPTTTTAAPTTTTAAPTTTTAAPTTTTAAPTTTTAAPTTTTAAPTTTTAAPTTTTAAPTTTTAAPTTTPGP